MACLFDKCVLRRIAAALSAILVVLCIAAFLPVKAEASSYYEIRLDDLDDCLTSYEENELRAVMQKTADKIKCNIGIVITADLEGKVSSIYADDYLDSNFGYGSDSIVMLLLNRHDNPEYSNTYSYKDYISTAGRARNFYDSHINTIFDKAYRGLDNDFPCDEPNHKKNVYVASTSSQDSVQFYMTGVYFCKALKSYSSPVSRFFSDAVSFVTANFVVTVMIIAFTIGTTAVVVSKTVSGYKKKNPISAANYIDRSHFVVKREVDMFEREYTTSVTVSSSSGGGHGGHGGGGHGGGGGRSR